MKYKTLVACGPTNECSSGSHMRLLGCDCRELTRKPKHVKIITTREYREYLQKCFECISQLIDLDDTHESCNCGCADTYNKARELWDNLDELLFTPMEPK